MTGDRGTELGALALASFVGALGGKTPTPGGGASAAVTASIAAATARMVVSYSAGRKALAEHEAMLQDAAAALGDLERRALALGDADAAAYGRLSALWKLDADDATRRRDFPAAVTAAIDAPMSTIDAALGVLEQVERLAGRSNRNLASDLEVAAILAEAAARAAACNVRINLPQVDDAGRRDALEQQTAARLASARVRFDTITSRLSRRS